MTTRESTRRELQDLAKLAASMPKERPTPLPERPALQRPSTPSSISVNVPPAVASIPPPSDLASASASGKRSRTPLVIVSVSLGLALAIAGGAEVGRYVARRGATSAAAGAPVMATANATVASLPPAPAAAPLPAPPAAPAPDTVPPAVAAAATMTPAARATPTAAPKRWQPAPHPAAAKTSLTATIPTSGGGGSKDSLEDAIRKAVAAAPPK
jgi:hypothetical protein